MVKLTDTELLSLRLSADGLSIKEIAYKNHYNYYTIKAALQKAKNKLQANNKTHAVAIAIREGYFV